MEADERAELVVAVVDALEERGVVDGARLADLMRSEAGLVDALAVVRREIDLVVRATKRSVSREASDDAS